MKQLQYISVTGNTWYELNHQFTTGEKIDAVNATFDVSVSTAGRHQQLIAGGGGDWVRIGGANSNQLYTSYYGDNKIYYGNINLNNDHILLTNGAFYINDVSIGTFSQSTTGIKESTYMCVFANNKSGGDSVSGQTASVGIITLYDENDNIVAQYLPVIDDSDNICFYETVSGAYLYKKGTGTPIAGPLASTIIVSSDKTRIPASGGTINVTIESDYDWTASSTGNWYTMSSISGTSADTAITITAPSTTSTTQVEDTITFTNATGDTDTLTIKQNKYSPGGIHLLCLGSEELTDLFIGGDAVEYIYLGSEVVYQSGEFIGLKMKSTAFLGNTSGSTGSTRVRSSEPWTLTMDSNVTWLSASTLSGPTGTTDITLTATEDNLSYLAPRSTVITATSQSFSATCEVTQNQAGYFYITSVNNDNYDAINLELPASNDIVVEVKGMWKGVANGTTVIGYYGGYDSYDGWRFFNYSNSLYFDWGNNRINEDSGSYGPSGQTFDFEIGNYYVKDNTTGNNIISGSPVSNTYQGFDIQVCVGTIWIHSIKIYKNNVLVFDGVAKEENGTLGIYDSISSTLYYNPELQMTSYIA